MIVNVIYGNLLKFLFDTGCHLCNTNYCLAQTKCEDLYSDLYRNVIINK